MLQYFRFLLIVLLAAFIFSCSVPFKIQYSNPTLEDVYANVEIKDKNDQTIATGFSKIPGTRCSTWTDSNRINRTCAVGSKDTMVIYSGKANDKINIKYYPMHSDAKFSVPPIVITPALSNGDTNSALVPLNGIKMYDVNDSKSALLGLANELGVDQRTELYRAIDFMPKLGAILIGKMKNNKFEEIDRYYLSTYEFKDAAPIHAKDHIAVTKDLIDNLKVSVPVYGTVDWKMDAGSFYNLNWDIEHYTLSNNMSMLTAFSKLTDDQRILLKKYLQARPDSVSLYYISQMNVISNGAFSISNGTKLASTQDAAIASMFSNTGSYNFSNESENVALIPNQVYNIKYNEWLNKRQVVSMIGDDGKIISPQIPDTTKVPIVPNEYSIVSKATSSPVTPLFVLPK